MKDKIVCIVFNILFLASALMAQNESSSKFEGTFYPEESDEYIEEELEDFYYSRHSEIGLDFTPLISKLVPFNLSENEVGLIGLKYKRYKRTHAFRLNIGARLDDTSDDFNNFFYFSLGYEKRKSLATKWSYVTGWEFVSFFEESPSFRDETFIGVSKFFGFEYNISDNIFLAAEGNLLLLWSDDDAKIQFNVPQSIFFFVRF